MNPLRDTSSLPKGAPQAHLEFKAAYYPAWSHCPHHWCLLSFYFSPLSTQVPESKINQFQKEKKEEKKDSFLDANESP